jgi:hypothetical protein
MTVDDLIEMADARLALCAQRRSVAVADGDVQAVIRLDAEIAQTEATRTVLLTSRPS